MPLQQALEREFPKSKPYASGGTLRKSDESVLLVVLKTDFDPRSNSQATLSKIESRLKRLRSLSSTLGVLVNYQVLALHLYRLQWVCVRECEREGGGLRLQLEAHHERELAET